MGMKDVKNEPQSSLASNLVSGPKESSESDYSNLVSMPKPVEDSAASVGENLVSHAGHATTKAPG